MSALFCWDPFLFFVAGMQNVSMFWRAGRARELHFVVPPSPHVSAYLKGCQAGVSNKSSNLIGIWHLVLLLHFLTPLSFIYKVEL